MIKRLSALGIPLAMLVLAGCNGEESAVGNEKANAAPTLGEISQNKATSFATAEEWNAKVVAALEEFNKDKALRKSFASSESDEISKVDRFQLYLLSKFGKVTVDGGVVLSDDLLRKEGESKPLPTELGGEGALRKTAAWPNPPARSVQQNMGPYKTIGQSFFDNYVTYNQIGGLTQFRKNLGWSGWWDNNAGRIHVRVLYINNPGNWVNGIFYPLGNSYVASEGSDTNSDDDYVSDRRVVAGTGNAAVRDNYAAAWSYHEVDHAGYHWRLESSLTGMDPYHNIRIPLDLNGHTGFPIW